MSESLASDWQRPPRVHAEDDLPGHEELHWQHVGEILRKVMRVRVIFLPITGLFLTLIVLYEHQARWVVPVLALVVTLQALVFAFDAVRLRGQQVYRRAFIALDLLAMVLLQTGAIWFTGAVESPLLVIYIPVGLLAGIAVGPSPVRWAVVVLVSLFIWLMAAAGLAGWVPRTVPGFLDLGPGFYQRATYVVATMGVLNVVVVVASHVGTLIYGAIGRMIAQAIAARQQTLDALADQNRDLVALSATIAHELKNPLASIQGLAQLLDRPSSAPERRHQRVAVLQREVERMRDILDELLNFSRPLGVLSTGPLQPEELIGELTALHEAAIRSRGIRVVAPQGPSPSIDGDARKTKQALINLLQNALEATPRGGTVTWIVERRGDRVAIGLRDSGAGIDPAILARAGRPGVTTKSSGSGIGLAVARAIAEQHGGALRVGNRAAGGCEAVLELPAARSVPADAGGAR